MIDKAGFILTNNHVVEDADEIQVGLYGANMSNPNEHLYAAKVVGRDTLTDSALIQLTEMPATPLQEAKFGDSDQMQPGDWVMAIGNPFNLSHTVTVGVISALGRPFGGLPGRPQNMLQTDAAINPGNSGGPLLNVRGEVVGMNTAIYTDQRSANIGIGFATPINTIRAILPQLRTGKVTRGVIGVQVRTYPLTKEDAQAFGLPNTNGAVLTTVTEGRPAEKAGLKPGDVVTEFNGKPVVDSDALVSMVITTKPGTTVPLTVYREGQRKSMNITIGELDLDAEQGTPTEPDVDSEPTSAGFGMTHRADHARHRARVAPAERQRRRHRQQRRPRQPGLQRRGGAKRRHPRGEPQAGHQRQPGQAGARRGGARLDGVHGRLASWGCRRSGDVPDAAEEIGQSAVGSR